MKVSMARCTMAGTRTGTEDDGDVQCGQGGLSGAPEPPSGEAHTVGSRGGHLARAAEPPEENFDVTSREGRGRRLGEHFGELRQSLGVAKRPMIHLFGLTLSWPS